MLALITNAKWDVNTGRIFGGRFQMPQLVIKKYLGLENIENIFLFDATSQKEFVDFDTIMLESVHHAFVSRCIACSDDGYPDRLLWIINSIQSLFFDILDI